MIRSEDIARPSSVERPDRDAGAGSGVVFNILRYAVHDGPGIRVTCFLKGCPLRCWWCHNPEGMRIDPRLTMERHERFMRWGCALAGEEYDSQHGSVMTVGEVLREIEKETIFMDESGGGATFSGGEPLMQPEFLLALLAACREHGIHTAVDTSGFANGSVFRAVAARTDLFLYDLKLMDDATHRKYVGAPNKPILDNLRWLAGQGRPAFRIRVPVIPGITDGERNLAAMGEFLLALHRPIAMDLLPYHQTALHKYEALNLENRMQGTQPPPAERMAAIRERFAQLGFDVHIGG